MIVLKFNGYRNLVVLTNLKSRFCASKYIFAQVHDFPSPKEAHQTRHDFSNTNSTKMKRLYVTRLLQNLGKVQPPESNLACRSQKLMLYNEIVESSHQGCYFMLPLGMRAMEKLTRLIDEEMQAIDGQKMAVPTLSPSELWEKSGRWTTAGSELFKLKDRHGQNYCLGPTHEELVTTLIASLSPLSYRRLPIRLYQISRKFRDEKNPKYVLLRGREFEMKDMYTFDADEIKAKETYEAVCDAYTKIFKRLKLDYLKVEGDTGNIGGKLSHEFHLLSSIGEDKLLICEQCGFRSNAELVGDKDRISFCKKERHDCKLYESPGIEIGHTFLLETKYSSIFNATFSDKDKKQRLTQMGCYGIGVSRLLQGSLEVLSSDRHLRWPQLIAPYQICIIPQKTGFKSEEFFKKSEDLSDTLNSLPNMQGEIVIDDRVHMTVGRRLYEARRIGYPYVIVVGKQVLESPSLFEVICTGESEWLTMEQLYHTLADVSTI